MPVEPVSRAEILVATTNTLLTSKKGADHESWNKQAAVGFLALIATGATGVIVGSRISGAATEQQSHAPDIVRIRQ